jgi:hypothetical protein
MSRTAHVCMKKICRWVNGDGEGERISCSTKKHEDLEED